MNRAGALGLLLLLLRACCSAFHGYAVSAAPLYLRMPNHPTRMIAVHPELVWALALPRRSACRFIYNTVLDKGLLLSRRRAKARSWASPSPPQQWRPGPRPLGAPRTPNGTAMTLTHTTRAPPAWTRTHPHISPPPWPSSARPALDWLAWRGRSPLLAGIAQQHPQVSSGCAERPCSFLATHVARLVRWAVLSPRLNTRCDLAA